MVTGLDNGKPGESPGRKARGPTPGGSFANHSGHGSQFPKGYQRRSSLADGLQLGGNADFGR
jgi:hypothetical protein